MSDQPKDVRTAALELLEKGQKSLSRDDTERLNEVANAIQEVARNAFVRFRLPGDALGSMYMNLAAYEINFVAAARSCPLGEREIDLVKEVFEEMLISQAAPAIAELTNVRNSK